MQTENKDEAVQHLASINANYLRAVEPQKPKVEIKYWKSAKVPTVQYGSKDICLTLSSLVDSDKVAEEYEKLRAFVDEKVDSQANSIANDLSNVRIREKNGKKYPSVTSILSPDPINIPNIEKYATRGTEIHRLINKYLADGVWETPTADCSPLKYEDIRYKEFFDKHDVKFRPKMDFLNLEVFNEKHLYSGEIDIYCKYEGKLTVGDFKTGSWKLEQLVAYAKCASICKIEQIAIFDLKKCVVETWTMDEPEVEEAWENFLKLRGRFYERFKL